MADSDTLCQASELMEKQLQLISEIDRLEVELSVTATLHRWNCEKAAEMRDIEFRDEDFAINSLTKHQASMTPILDSYSSVIKETSAVVTQLSKTPPRCRNNQEEGGETYREDGCAQTD